MKTIPAVMKSARMRLSSALGAVAVAMTLSTAPAPAQAWCGLCAPVMYAVQSSTSSILSAIAQSTNSVITAISTSTQLIINAIGGSTESLIGANEKVLSGMKELEQASLNYDAAASMSETFATSQEMFVAPEGQAFRRCELLAQAKQATSVSEDARLNAKVMTASHANRNMNTTSSADAARKVLDDYKSNYCSAEDRSRGRCTTEAPLALQGAPTRADVLLTPVANSTYSEAESRAASSFITMVTNPAPVEALPRGLEKSAAGERFVLEQMHSSAQMSVAQHSLEQIKASKESSESAAGAAAANGYSGALSLVGLMEKFTKDKFGNSEYAKELHAKNEHGLLKEMNIQMAFNNWLGFQTYSQNERIEALIATQLAAAARERADRQLAVARGMAGKSR